MADIIYVKPVGGLCNRLRVIDSVYGLARQSGKKMVVLWEKNADLNCGYSSLFRRNKNYSVVENLFDTMMAPSLNPDRFVGWRRIRRLTHRYFCRARGINRSVFYDDFSALLSRLQPVSPTRYLTCESYDLAVRDAFDNEISMVLGQGNFYLASCWRLSADKQYEELFQPNREIEQQVDGIAKKFNADTIGLHIRGTDQNLSSKYSPPQLFERLIQKKIDQRPKTTFFLATDEPTIKSRILSRFSNHIFVLPQDDYKRNRSANIMNSLVDMLCLSRTSKIFGSYFSSFSHVAADWQGIDCVPLVEDSN